MSYIRRKTVINGEDRRGKRQTLILPGHMDLNAAVNRARQAYLNGELLVEHSVIDISGKDLGHDGKWKVSSNDEVDKVEEWQKEGHIRYTGEKIH